MEISARLTNRLKFHELKTQAHGVETTIDVLPKPSGYGSLVSGGEMLMAALATCFCNDIYREATRRNIEVKEVLVQVWGEFYKEGEPGCNFHYSAQIDASCSDEDKTDLILHTDKIAEIQNTLRNGVTISLDLD